MRRLLPICVLLTVFASYAEANQLQKAIKSRWLGAWVVATVESYSDCGGYYTNNRINGNLVNSSGRLSFPSGELAKLDKVDIKRSRLDLHLSLQEPMLASYKEGPFTLYRQVSCKVEMEVVLPRDVVKSKDVAAVERAIGEVLERHANRDAAEASPHWNARERDDYPADYELTLARLEVWRVEQFNAKVEAQLARARERTRRVTERVTSDPVYLSGFAQGVEKARDRELEACSAMLAVELGESRRRSRNDSGSTGEDRSDRGFEDGRQLVLSLALLDRLPGCFRDVPPLPDGAILHE